MASTNPSLPSTKETSNYARLCHLLVNVGSCVLKGIFDRVCPPENLHAALANPSNHTTLQTLRKKRVLSNTQWGKLYPAFTSSVSSRDFDSSLLLLLLRNIFGVTFPASGWNNIPSESDTSPEADITRLKFFRQIVYSHASVASVDNSTFSFYWNNIKDTFLRIGGASYGDVINDIASRCIDADLEEHYRELLREWLKDEDCIASKLQKDEMVKKARKEEDMEGAIDISEQNSGMGETEIKCAENRSALKANISLPELSVKLPKMSDLPDTSSAWSNVELPVDILLLTVEDCEFLSCIAYLKKPFKSYHNSIGYVYFGCTGDGQGKKMKIALMRCSKGSDVPGGSLSAAKDAISLLRPKATFSVGACSGLNNREVKLGDVVVSSKLITAAHKTPPSRDIGNLIKHVADGWKAPLQNADEYNAKVHCDGVFLSISEENKDMIGQHPEAIAVEMEGGGVFAAAHDFKTEWVVVKGVKDFANERQSSGGEWKQIACVMAASVVANILSDPVIFQDWPHFNAGANELPAQGLPGKPTITNVESEVDKDFTVTWSEVEANSSNCSIKYRLEWTKQPMTQSTELVQRGNIVETHYEITGLEYDAEYEVQLFAINKQGDSEPDVRTFKTKSERFKETPTEFEELSENVDALTIRPASNKRAKTEELGHPSFTLTEGKAGVSASSASSFFSSRATKQEQDNIVATAMKFEAEHEEMVRVLVYTESGFNIKVQLYVQYGESGIPQELQNAAQGCFGEMDVTLEWLDLINDADRILKIRSLEYPSGTPQDLTKSQASEISQAIRDNLHVLVRHRNITSVQPSLKITNSKQTDTPCITLYVLRKGVIPVGECDFPLFLGSYPIDVVDGFWFRTIGPWKPNEAQKNSEVLRLGASIGVQGEDSAGTLGAVIKGGDKFFALSCHHVMKRESSSEIIHPAQNDHLNNLKYHLREYRLWLRKIVDTDIPVDQFDVDDLTEQDQLKVRFEELKELRERYRDRITENSSILKKVDKHENEFEEGLEALPRVIARYSAGVSRNVTWYSETHYIDAAVAELTADEVNQLQRNPTTEVIGTGYSPSGEVISWLEVQGKFHKSGRTTGYTKSGEFVDYHLFPICSLCELNRRNPALLSVLQEVKLCVQCARRTEFAALRSSTDSCNYCSQETQALCDALYLYNCLCIKNKEPFPEKGDSGAVLFEMDQNEKLRGFGIIFGVHLHSFHRVALASPLDIALKTLAEEIGVDKLRLLSNYRE